MHEQHSQVAAPCVRETHQRFPPHAVQIVPDGIVARPVTTGGSGSGSGAVGAGGRIAASVTGAGISTTLIGSPGVGRPAQKQRHP
jgi:hypothetical protein